MKSLARRSIPAMPCAARNSQAPTIPGPSFITQRRTSMHRNPEPRDSTLNCTRFYRSGPTAPPALSGATRPPRPRGSFPLDGTLKPVSIGATLNYRSHMYGVDPSNGPACLQLTDPNPHCYVASFTYLDMYGQYEFSPRLQMTATISNVTTR